MMFKMTDDIGFGDGAGYWDVSESFFYVVSITFSFSWFVFCRISVTTVLLLPTYSRNICSSLVAFPLIITPQVNL